ncbi:MAG: DUF3109 family protein [Candidatus Kapaibacteriota bacterium]
MSVLEGVIYSRNELIAPFECDLGKCKGACCFIEGEFGAPLKANELKEINDILPWIWDLLPEKSKKVIECEGWWRKQNGRFYTNVVNKRECVFAYFEGGIAKCSIEHRYKEGKISFRKPISCHLFPLRENSFILSEIKYTKIPECNEAIINGIKNQKPLYVFLKEALIRRFGENWYKRLIQEEFKEEHNGEDRLGGVL